MNPHFRLFVSGLTLFITCQLAGATPGASSLPGSASHTIPPVVYPSKPAGQVKKPVEEPAHLQKPVLPPMAKPFGMPGIVGLRDGKWEGTDYLGSLSKYIAVDIEVLKGSDTTVIIDTAQLESVVDTILKNEGLIPNAETSQGPPLPFLHVLVILYPVEKDKYVIFSTCRLFEEIQVVRKDFKPAGFWQGITWENQDISLASGEQLNAQIKSSLEALVIAFTDRYRLYNTKEESK